MMNIKSMDDILPLVGDYGPYQKLLFALLCFPFAFFFPYLFMSQVLTSLKPEHWCRIPELEFANWSLLEIKEHFIPRNSENELSSCYMYDGNYSLFSNNSSDENRVEWLQVECKAGWIYNLTPIYETLASELDLVCHNTWYIPFSQMIFFVGSIVGTFILGHVADHCGRFYAVMLASLFAFVGGLASALAPNYYFYVAFQFIYGFAYDCIYMFAIILVLEFIRSSKRGTVTNVCQGVFLCLGCISMPWLAKLIGNWRYFVMAGAVPYLLPLFLWCVIPESVRWLLNKGRLEEAAIQLEKIAKFNNKELGENFSQDLQKQLEMIRDNNPPSTSSAFDLLRSKSLRRRFLLVCLIWLLCVMCYDGSYRNIQFLGSNIFESITYGNLAEIPAAIFVILGINILGRRWLMCFSLILAGISSVTSYVIWQAETSTVTLVFFVLNRLFCKMSINTMIQFSIEVLPTVIRARAIAYSHILGFGGNICSILILRQFSAVQSQTSKLVFGLSALVGSILPLFLPETLGRHLPETVSDCKMDSQDFRFLDFPLIQRFQRSQQPKTNVESATSSNQAFEKD